MLQSQSSIRVVALLFCVFVRKSRRQPAVDYIGIELKKKRNKSPCGVLPSSRALISPLLRTIPSAGSHVGQIEAGSDVSPSSGREHVPYCDLYTYISNNLTENMMASEAAGVQGDSLIMWASGRRGSLPAACVQKHYR